MKTLVELCHIFISENAAKYSESSLSELPVIMLTVLASHLSAFQLNRLTQVFTSAGIDTQPIWKLHSRRRWLTWTAMPIFGGRLYNSTADARQLYMEHHFHDILRNLAFKQIKDPRICLDTCLYRYAHKSPTCLTTLSTTPPTPSADDVKHDLYEYAHYARTLTLRAVQCAYVVDNGPLMAILRDRVRRLSINWLIDELYESVVALVRSLMQRGVLADLVLLHFKLSKLLMRDLLMTCAGLHKHYTPGSSENKKTEDDADESNLDMSDDCSSECASTSTVHGESNMDLYDVALTTYREKQTACLTGIAVITGPHCSELIKLLSEIVPQWPQLQKIALYGALIGNDGLQKVLLQRLEHGELTHLVMVDCIFSNTHVLSDMLRTMCENQTDSNKDPMKSLVLYNNVETHSTFVDNMNANISSVREPFSGVVDLDLSHNLLYDGCVRLLVSVIRHDTALRHLKLDGCHMRDAQLVALVSSLPDNTLLETLSMADINLFIGDLNLDEHVVKLPQTMSSLTSLNMRACGLPKSLVTSVEFVNAIKKHPCLRELNLSGNRLGEASCDLLLSLLDEDSANMKLKSLDIGFNCIPGESLLSTARNIASRYRYNRTARLSRLTISGNRLMYLHGEVIAAFAGFVDELEADVFDSATFLADHASQM